MWLVMGPWKAGSPWRNHYMYLLDFNCQPCPGSLQCSLPYSQQFNINVTFGLWSLLTEVTSASEGHQGQNVIYKVQAPGEVACLMWGGGGGQERDLRISMWPLFHVAMPGSEGDIFKAIQLEMMVQSSYKCCSVPLWIHKWYYFNTYTDVNEC